MGGEQERQQVFAEGFAGAGVEYVRKAAEYTDDAEEKARACWAFGCLLETLRDYENAALVYAVPIAGPPVDGDAWYFVHNNLAFCLNKCGRFREAEVYCRLAIGIRPDRHNACKNLGLALAGQGRPEEAAWWFVAAVTRCPRDSRALHHLEDLVEEHREAVSAHPGILDQLEVCRRMVRAEGRPH